MKANIDKHMQMTIYSSKTQQLRGETCHFSYNLVDNDNFSNSNILFTRIKSHFLMNVTGAYISILYARPHQSEINEYYYIKKSPWNIMRYNARFISEISMMPSNMWGGQGLLGNYIIALVLVMLREIIEFFICLMKMYRS